MPKGVYTRRWNPISNLKPRPTRPWQERFWDHVDQSGDCWLWTGTTDKKGYGKLQTGTLAKPKLIAAHRLAWELATGVPPTRHVLHHCDNPPCIRFDHLFEGGYQENAADKVAKGRQTQGSKHPFAKLTESQVREIRALDWSLMSPSKIAAHYGISYWALRKLLRGETYRDVS